MSGDVRCHQRGRDEFSGYEHTVNSHINRLRNKVEKNIAAPEFILTTWGVGYRFVDA